MRELACVHVKVLIAHLEEPLDARARVLRPHALIAMGEEEHKTGLAHPLLLAAGREEENGNGVG